MSGSPASIHLYVEDVDSIFQQAVDAGCQVMPPVMDAFWGDRYGKVLDPFGYQWGIATHTKDLSEEEFNSGERSGSRGWIKVNSLSSKRSVRTPTQR